MKIEVAESLFISWLRHVRGCRIAQSNWKPSKTWEATNRERVESLFKKSRGYFFQEMNLDLYGKNRTVSQLVQQAEIDAIGFCETDDRPALIAIDVAFHEAGLNYGGKDATVARVVKKMLRTLFTMESYFPDYSREIIFAAPKINNSVQVVLNEAMTALDRFLEENEIAAECQLISNDDFFTEVINPVSQLSPEIADTGELFMRSVQLISMAPTHSKLPEGNVATAVEDRPSEHQPKIGSLVRQKFQALLEQKLLSPEEIANLCTVEYSRRSFGIRYAALVKSDRVSDRFDSHGNARYYSKVIAGEFLLCNDWYERNRKRFMSWLSSIEENKALGK